MIEGEFKVERDGQIERQFIGKHIVTFAIDNEGNYHLMNVERNPKFPEPSKAKQIKEWFRFRYSRLKWWYQAHIQHLPEVQI